MQHPSATPKKPISSDWLSEVVESRQPLSDANPIWVRHGVISSGPPVPHAEQHPYCEISFGLNGRTIVMVEQEEALKLPGDLLLLGPGMPHNARVLNYPLHFITVYFLASVLVEAGPVSDGVRTLRRFTVKQPLSDRLIRPSREMLRHIKPIFQQMIAEFERPCYGREIKLRTLLMDLLVLLFRWEESKGVVIWNQDLDTDWRPITRTLAYLRTHYQEPIYAQELAKAAGLSVSRLKFRFKEALGISWVKYLQGYRIHRAAALLSEPGHNVTEAAFAVGFDSLSHFNTLFRSLMGICPREYRKRSEERRQRQPKTNLPLAM